MKKLIIILGISCMSASVIAQQNQPGVRIGNMEIIVRKQEQDTTVQVNVLDKDCPPCPTENENRSKPENTFKKYSKSDGFCGVGFIIPDKGDGYYPVLGGNSINIDVGQFKTEHYSRWFALGRTIQYSYYNYKFNGVDEEPILHEVLGSKQFNKDDINKQVFRSHNIAVNLFARFYLVPPTRRYSADGVYIDVGAQGDFAAFRHYMIKDVNKKKEFFPNKNAFNPLTASAIVRFGWRNNRAIFVRYRLSDAFNKPDALPMDLPPITIGIHLF